MSISYLFPMEVLYLFSAISWITLWIDCFTQLLKHALFCCCYCFDASSDFTPASFLHFLFTPNFYNDLIYKIIEILQQGIRNRDQRNLSQKQGCPQNLVTSLSKIFWALARVPHPCHIQSLHAWLCIFDPKVGRWSKNVRFLSPFIP